ncbi:hypothetical protein [Rhizobium sullae]|uniref:hypothetical protein n=1 Tax=Rhizobium sullae TaxID=50338 RepID=UPI0014047867|nr:hypothetical protein [Rhizobium sullae]
MWLTIFHASFRKMKSSPNVALLIGWATGKKVGILEISAIILVLASIAMLQIGRQRAVRQVEQSVAATAKP